MLLPTSSLSQQAQTQNPDEIYTALIREDLDRYNTELRPLEEFYTNQLLGPQAQQNRTNLLQTVSTQTNSAFDRAEARIGERNRLAGLGGITKNDKSRIGRHRGLAQAKNATDAGRAYDNLTRELL